MLRIFSRQNAERDGRTTAAGKPRTRCAAIGGGEGRRGYKIKQPRRRRPKVGRRKEGRGGGVRSDGGDALLVTVRLSESASSIRIFRNNGGKGKRPLSRSSRIEEGERNQMKKGENRKENFTFGCSVHCIHFTLQRGPFCHFGREGLGRIRAKWHSAAPGRTDLLLGRGEWLNTDICKLRKEQRGF